MLAQFKTALTDAQPTLVQDLAGCAALAAMLIGSLHLPALF